MKVLIAIGSALVLSNLGMGVLLLQRQNDSSGHLVRLEKNVDKGMRTIDQLAGRIDASERRLDDLAGDFQRRNAAVDAPAKAQPQAGLDSHESGLLSDAQRDAVRKEAEKVVKDKLASTSPFMRELGDPVATMEEELDLRPSQKVRIRELMSRMEKEQMEVFTDPKNPTRFEMDFAKLTEIMEILQKYNEAVLGELDPAQQVEFEELKMQGKLPIFGGDGSFGGGAPAGKKHP